MTIIREYLYPQAISRLLPNAEYSLTSDSYDSLNWHDKRKKPTKEELEREVDKIIQELPMRMLREARDSMLSATDWLAVSDRQMSTEEKNFRQALRDITKTNTNPQLDNEGKLTNVSWPKIPASAKIRLEDFFNDH